jgi:hypothetical protein
MKQGASPPALTDIVLKRRSAHASFFLRHHDGEDFTPDYVGMELEGLEAAKAEAKKALPDIVKDAMPNGDRRALPSS